MKRWFILPSVLAGAAFALGTAALAQDAADAAKQRSAIMKNVSGTVKELAGAAKSGKAGAGEAAKAAALQGQLKKFLTLFPKGSDLTKVKTRAKPEIWAEWPKFEATGKSLVAALGEVESTAKAGNGTAFAAAVKKAQSVCGNCHKPYRGPAPK